MAVGSTVGGEEDVNESEREVLGEVAGAEREDVGVVVLAGVLRRREVERHRGAHAGDLVRDHARSDARAVDDDAEPRLPARDRLGRRPREDGVVARLGGVGPDVEHGTPSPTRCRSIASLSAKPPWSLARTTTTSRDVISRAPTSAAPRRSSRASGGDGRPRPASSGA